MAPLLTHLGRIVRGSITCVVRYPRVKRLALTLLDRVPALQVKVHAWARHAEVAPPRRYHVPLDKDDLSPGMQAEFDELKRHTNTGKH